MSKIIKITGARPYTFKVGKAGYKRLEIVNSICNQPSLHFLQKQQVLRPGIKILEVGCGTGQMAATLAQEILPNGEIDAVDNSEEQLQLADQHLKHNNVRNVTLYKLSADELEAKLKRKYDLIYCRLLLTHLANPDSVISTFKKLLKPDGAVVSEDPQTSAYFCSPQSDIFDYWLKKRIPLLHFNMDFGFDAHLKYRQAGFSNIDVQTSQPVLQSPNQKAYLRYAFLELFEEQVGKGKAFPNKKMATKFINKLITLENDEKYIIGFMRLFQICARTEPPLKKPLFKPGE